MLPRCLVLPERNDLRLPGHQDDQRLLTHQIVVSGDDLTFPFPVMIWATFGI
jgi:hypothetical protein